VKLSNRARKLLIRLAMLNRTEGQPDSRENPLETRKERVLSLRKQFVRALGEKKETMIHH